MAFESNIGRSAARARGLRITVILAFAALVAVLPAAPEESGRQTGQKPMFETPRLLIRESEKDFGDVIRGRKIEAVFELENVGGQPLRVLDAKPG